jgi:hypothetical protein
MLSVTYKPLMLSVIMPNVVMLIVVAPLIVALNYKVVSSLKFNLDFQIIHIFGFISLALIIDKVDKMNKI